MNLKNTHVKNEKLYVFMEHDTIIHLIEKVKKVFIYFYLKILIGYVPCFF
jgi:hypothetical protein